VTRRIFFEAKRNELLVAHEDDKPQYFKAVVKLLEAEISRVDEFLHKSTRGPLLKVFTECMLLPELQGKAVSDDTIWEACKEVLVIVDKYKLGHEALADIFKQSLRMRTQGRISRHDGVSSTRGTEDCRVRSAEN